MKANPTALVMGLYSLMLHNLGYPEEKNLNRYLLSEELTPWFTVTPGLKAAVQTYIRGEDVDPAELGLGLRTLSQTLARNPDVGSLYSTLVKAFGSWFRSGSDSAYRSLDKLSVKFKQPWLASFFAKEVRSQAPTLRSLKSTVKRLTGQARDALTPEEAANLKENNPEQYKEYLSLRKEFNLTWKDALNTFVRESGKPTVPMKEAERFFAKKELKTNMPSGFTGRIDADGKWYTAEDKVIKGVPSSVLYPTVVMNPEYKDGSGHAVFIPFKEDGTQGNYFYTLEDTNKAAELKYRKVKKLTVNIENIRKRWLSYMMKFDEENPDTVAAVVIELIFQTSARIGTPGNSAKGIPTYGLNTILVKHFYPQSDGSFVLRYPGKDGVKTVYKIRPVDKFNKALSKILTELSAGKKPSQPLFTYKMPNGTRKPLQSMRVNALFRKLGAGDVGMHKIRTYTATKLFRELMEETFSRKKEFKTPSEAMKAFLLMALEAGKKLNHVRRGADGSTVYTPNTVLKSYIDPGAQEEFWRHYSFAIPKYLEELLKKGETASTEQDQQDDLDDAESPLDLSDLLSPEEADQLFNNFGGPDNYLPGSDSDPLKPDNLLRDNS